MINLFKRKKEAPKTYRRVRWEMIIEAPLSQNTKDNFTVTRLFTNLGEDCPSEFLETCADWRDNPNSGVIVVRGSPPNILYIKAEYIRAIYIRRTEEDVRY